jgi:NhaC family Na+:H+ antiporter
VNNSTVKLWQALLPVATVPALSVLAELTIGFDGDVLVLVLLGAATVAGMVAVRNGASWDDIQRAAGEKLLAALPVVIILLSIGALIATWMMAGTIPLLVSWGVKLVSPGYITLTAFLATAVMSLFTGTSWGSAGTIGVALMGTALALDAPMAATAGAVVSGAYLGDKMSALSDSTVISALGAGANLYKHIRQMLYTTIPSLVLCLIVYTSAAYFSPATQSGAPASAAILAGELDSVFTLNLVVLVPVAVVLWGIVKRVPPALAISMSALVAGVIAITLQGFQAGDALLAAVRGFRTASVAATGADPEALSAAFRALAERGGIYSMSNTLVVIVAAFLLAGAMEVSGALDLLVKRMLAAVRGTFGLVAATMSAGATTIAMTSHGGVTALIIGGLFQKAYAERGLAPENLSRSVEDSVTITEPLMPWTVSAVYMATTLGVPTMQYAPWAVFCYGGPIFSLLLAATFARTGFGLRTVEQPGGAKSG